MAKFNHWSTFVMEHQGSSTRRLGGRCSLILPHTLQLSTTMVSNLSCAVLCRLQLSHPWNPVTGPDKPLCGWSGLIGFFAVLYQQANLYQSTINQLRQKKKKLKNFLNNVKVTPAKLKIKILEKFWSKFGRFWKKFYLEAILQFFLMISTEGPILTPKTPSTFKTLFPKFSHLRPK